VWYVIARRCDGHVANRHRFKLTRPSTSVMHHLRKSKAPTDIPASTSTPPSDLVKRRDSGALATLSAGIALSIGSPSNDSRSTPSDGATIQGTDAIRQTTYAVARMVVETTKESSDLCLPLKAVVGAVSVLMKNYDVSVLFINRTHTHPSLVSRSSKRQTMWRK
jgi:hypothetical protein